jgi:cytochrome c
MIRRISITFLAGLMFFAALPSSAYQRGTAQEAEALLEKAIARYKEVGAAQTIAEINDGRSFADVDLYVVVVGSDKRIVAHGIDQTAIGDPMLYLKDMLGRPAVDQILAATTDGIWIDYYSWNYFTRKYERKSSLAKRVDDYIFMCGYYPR